MLEQIIAQIPRLHAFHVRVPAGAMGRTLAMTALGCGVGIVLWGHHCGDPRYEGACACALLSCYGAGRMFRRIPFLVNLFIVMFALQGFGSDISSSDCNGIHLHRGDCVSLRRSFAPGLNPCRASRLEAAEVMNFASCARCS